MLHVIHESQRRAEEKYRQVLDLKVPFLRTLVAKSMTLPRMVARLGKLQWV
jgi:hypothetical protein